MATLGCRGFACRQAGLLVPEEVAVLAGDNDPLLCAHAAPSLSAIDISTRRIGLAAAARLECLLRGGRQPADTTLVPPVGVVTRQSTDALAGPDAELARALRQIRQRACEAIHVDNIVRDVALSRRQLERAFRDLLGRTPAEEIRRVGIAGPDSCWPPLSCPWRTWRGRAGSRPPRISPRPFVVPTESRRSRFGGWAAWTWHVQQACHRRRIRGKQASSPTEVTGRGHRWLGCRRVK